MPPHPNWIYLFIYFWKHSNTWCTFPFQIKLIRIIAAIQLWLTGLFMIPPSKCSKAADFSVCVIFPEIAFIYLSCRLACWDTAWEDYTCPTLDGVISTEAGTHTDSSAAEWLRPGQFNRSSARGDMLWQGRKL